MSSNIQRSRGRGSSYKFDRGGTPTEMGPYIGVVMNNIDPTRTGRLEVYIEQFAGNDPNDKTLWRTVSYIPPFYGVTPDNSATTTQGRGNFKGNPQSYGMWFTPPDLGVRVICFFVAGDPNQGYYIGCIPEDGSTHMIPAIGASKKFIPQNTTQQGLIQGANAKQLPVVEANFYNSNTEKNPKFYTIPKPVHSYQFAVMAQQGLLGDTVRGPISSNSQRESPSQVFGISTPGRPIYRGGLDDKTIRQQLDSGQIKLSDIEIEGRRGGHSIVLDDGDIRGVDNLIRIRTSKGHQITMSDDGDCFYFIHANGQSWIEMGSEGTVDVYATNSVNIRTEGVLNLHADKDVNINAGGNLNLKGKTVAVESTGSMTLNSAKNLTVYSKLLLGISSNGSVAVKSTLGSWDSTGPLNLKGAIINLNGFAPGTPVPTPTPIQAYKLDDTTFSGSQGWTVKQGSLESIVNRAPTHEPYPYHNVGVPVTVNLAEGGGAPAAPAEFSTQVDATLDETAGITVDTPINNGDLLTVNPAESSIGNLNTAQVTGLLAQAKATVNQPAAAVSITKGIGEFGFQPDQLEAAGYLKPGTASNFKSLSAPTPTQADIDEAAKSNISPEEAAKNRQLLTKLSAPSVWTGKDGVSTISGLLGNSQKQSTIQQSLMNTVFNGMKSSGLLTGNETAQKLGSLVQSATKFGVGDVTSWVKGTATQQVSQALGISSKNAQYAVDFVTSKVTNQLGDLGSIGSTATNALNSALGELTGPLRGLGGLGDQLGSLSGLTSLGGFAGGLSGLGGLLSSGGALGSLNNLLGGSGLSNLSNLLGAGSLNSITSALGIGNLGNLGGLISGGGIGGALGSLGSIGGLSSLGGFFGGGGGAIPARYAVNTVNRSSVDRIINAAIGDPKIPNIDYTT